jgi:Domain of unknown function (DUF4399)
VKFGHLFRTALVATPLGLFGAQLPALAQQWTPPTPSITAPATGASVSSPVTVSYGLSFPGGGQAPVGDAPADGHHKPPQAFLVIDSATPAAGSGIQATPDDIAFPTGQTALGIALPPGHHQLQIVFATRKGLVSRHIPPSAPVSISVQ